MTRYWCHICNSFVHVNNDPLRCVTCDGDFVEVVPGEEPVQQQPAFEPAPNPFVNLGAAGGNAQPGSFFDILSGMFRNIAQQPQPQFAGANAQPQAVAHDWTALQQQLDNLRNQQAQQAAQAPNQAGPGFVQYQIPLNQLFNFNFQGGKYVVLNALHCNLFFPNLANQLSLCSFQDLFGAFAQPQQFGDYASDAGMQAILDRLFRQHQSYATFF